MDKERTCESCRFYDPSMHSGGDLEIGNCHRNPPVIIEALLSKRNDVAYDIHWASRHPMLSWDNFCGEHTPKNQENANG